MRQNIVSGKRIWTWDQGHTPEVSVSLVALGLLLCLCGCSTPYQPAKGGKGFTDSQSSSNEFTVGFQGNQHTTLEDVYDFALLRSAEVVLQHGYRFFAVMDAANTSSVRSYIARQRYYSSAPAPGFGIPTISGGVVEVKEPQVDFRPGTVLRLQAFADKPVKPFTYDALELQQSLADKHRLHRSGNG
jgi:hypothetical protein